MIPTAWVAVVLALGVCRIVRLVGWDDFPPVVAARAWLVGMRETSRGSSNDRMRQTGTQVEVTYTFRRPLLYQWLACAFCFGFWLSAGVYVAWRYEPVWTVTVLAPFALSEVVGLVSKNLDV